jgi:hypothetical protein
VVVVGHDEAYDVAGKKKEPDHMIYVLRAFNCLVIHKTRYGTVEDLSEPPTSAEHLRSCEGRRLAVNSATTKGSRYSRNRSRGACRGKSALKDEMVGLY